jgi:hypothetical protein
MLTTIKRIDARGSVDVDIEGELVRVPYYEEEVFSIVNLGMFEVISTKLMYVYVTEKHASAFPNMHLPSIYPVFKVTFTRPPLPDPAFSGRNSEFYYYLPLAETERLLRLFDAGQNETADDYTQVDENINDDDWES